MRKYHNAILYMKGIDNDLHGTPEFLKTSSVNPDSEKKIDDELEDKCIEANISIYNNLGKNSLTLYILIKIPTFSYRIAVAPWVFILQKKSVRHALI